MLFDKLQPSYVQKCTYFKYHDNCWIYISIILYTLPPHLLCKLARKLSRHYSCICCLFFTLTNSFKFSTCLNCLLTSSYIILHHAGIILCRLLSKQFGLLMPIYAYPIVSLTLTKRLFQNLHIGQTAEGHKTKPLPTSLGQNTTFFSNQLALKFFWFSLSYWLFCIQKLLKLTHFSVTLF